MQALSEESCYMMSTIHICPKISGALKCRYKFGFAVHIQIQIAASSCLILLVLTMLHINKRGHNREDRKFVLFKQYLKKTKLFFFFSSGKCTTADMITSLA